MKVLWFILIVVFLLIEASTVSLVSSWFSVGALAAMIAALCGAEIWLQAVLFMVISVVLLACFRPMFRKFIKPRLVKTNVDAITEKTGIVLEKIDNIQSVGRVKIDGMEWSARSTENVTIAEGTVVRIDRVEGVKVFVTPVNT